MLKDYIEATRVYCKDGESLTTGFAVRFPADHRSFRLIVEQGWIAPRARLIFAAMRWTYLPGTRKLRHFFASHVALPLPFRLDV